MIRVQLLQWCWKCLLDSSWMWQDHCSHLLSPDDMNLIEAKVFSDLIHFLKISFSLHYFLPHTPASLAWELDHLSVFLFLSSDFLPCQNSIILHICFYSLCIFFSYLQKLGNTQSPNKQNLHLKTLNVSRSKNSSHLSETYLKKVQLVLWSHV